jgi:hypothetical protein
MTTLYWHQGKASVSLPDGRVLETDDNGVLPNLTDVDIQGLLDAGFSLTPPAAPEPASTAASETADPVASQPESTPPVAPEAPVAPEITPAYESVTAPTPEPDERTEAYG